jgi:hypothetical protein
LRSRIVPPKVQGSANVQLDSDGEYVKKAEIGSNHQESIFAMVQNKAGDAGEDRRGRASPSRAEDEVDPESHIDGFMSHVRRFGQTLKFDSVLTGNVGE